MFFSLRNIFLAVMGYFVATHPLFTEMWSYLQFSESAESDTLTSRSIQERSHERHYDDAMHRLGRHKKNVAGKKTENHFDDKKLTDEVLYFLGLIQVRKYTERHGSQRKDVIQHKTCLLFSFWCNEQTDGLRAELICRSDITETCFFFVYCRQRIDDQQCESRIEQINDGSFNRFQEIDWSDEDRPRLH